MLMRKSKSIASARVTGSQKPMQGMNDERALCAGPLHERERNHFNSSRLGRLRSRAVRCDGTQLRTVGIEAAFHVPEGDFMPFAARCACNPADFLLRR